MPPSQYQSTERGNIKEPPWIIRLLYSFTSTPSNMPSMRLGAYTPHTIPLFLGFCFYLWHQRSNDPAFVRLTAAFAVRYSHSFVFLFIHILRLTTKRSGFYQPGARRRRQASEDVTVYIPTVSIAENPHFKECLQKAIETRPSQIFIITNTESRATEAKLLVRGLDISKVGVRIKSAGKSNKRLQMMWLIRDVQTPFLAYCDDHVFLPNNFFQKVLPIFKDASVGLCGTSKRVRREEPLIIGKFSYLSWY